MYFKELLEVAIGLIFVWIVMSLVVMQLQEWVAGFFKWRAKDLKSAIQEILADETLAQQFYGHPMIKSLSKGSKLPSYIPSDKFALALFDIVMTAGTDTSKIQQALEVAQEKAKQIDEVPGQAIDDLITLAKKADIKVVEDIFRQLDQQFIDLIKAFPELDFDLRKIQKFATETPLDIKKLQAELQGLKKNLGGKLALGSEKLDEATVALERLLDLLQMADFDQAEAALNQLKQSYNNLVNMNPEAAKLLTEIAPMLETTALEQIKRGANYLWETNPELSRTLNSLVGNAQAFMFQADQQIGAARKNVETWFDDAMGRLSGEYKRRSQVVAFLIALVFGIFMNVDSISVATELWREPLLREAIIERSETLLAEQNTDQEQTSDETAANTPGKSIEDFKDNFEGLNLPLGWEFKPNNDYEKGTLCSPFSKEAAHYGVPYNGGCVQWQNYPAGWGGWSLKLSGILVSALAAMQGAPFWFDILGKLINVRSAGTKPPTQEEKEQSASKGR